MVTTCPMSQKATLEYLGYKFTHLFRNVYIVRNCSEKARRFSLYGIAVMRKGE